MTVFQVLFSFDGRLTRAPFIATYIPVVIAATVLRIFADVLTDLSARRAEVPGLWWPALIVAILVLVWINFAIIIKRCHDRDKSGSWALLSFIPLIGFLWAIIELGCFPGTRGSNRFGPDPRGAFPTPDARQSQSSHPAPSPQIREPDPLSPPPAREELDAPRPQAQPLKGHRPESTLPVSTSPMPQLDPTLQLYSRVHKEKLKLEDELAIFGDRAATAFREHLTRGASLADALRATELNLRHWLRLGTDAAWERSTRALAALKVANETAHQEIIKAYAALGADFDWDSALERLKSHHKSELEPATIADLAWLFDPTRQLEEPTQVPQYQQFIQTTRQPLPPAQDMATERVIEQPAKNHAGLMTLIVIILIGGLIMYGIMSNSHNRQTDALDTSGLTPAYVSELVAYGNNLAPFKQAIAIGTIKPTAVTGIARATQNELDKRGKMLPTLEIGDLEFMQTWWVEGEVSKMTPIRIVIDNTTRQRVKGIVFELSDTGCEETGAPGVGWIIDLAQPIEAETKSYLDVSLPVTAASDLWQNELVCGIIRQAW